MDVHQHREIQERDEEREQATNPPWPTPYELWTIGRRGPNEVVPEPFKTVAVFRGHSLVDCAAASRLRVLWSRFERQYEHQP